MKNWFAQNIEPKLKILDERIVTVHKNDDNLDMVKYWWQAFYQNSLIMPFLVANPDTHYQVAATMRLLLEISADVAFITKYPENIKDIVKIQKEIAKVQDAEGQNYTYRKAVKDAQKIRLYAYQNGVKRQFVKTEDRIKFIYEKHVDPTEIDLIYGLYSLYNHFNAAAVIWEGNKTRVTKNMNDALQDNLVMYSYYPLFLDCMVTSVAELLGENGIKEYGKGEIKSQFDKIKTWRADEK